MTATRLGGQHGYDDAAQSIHMGGAVVGFAKTYKRERPECQVKALDFEAESRPPGSRQLYDRRSPRDPGAVEIGYTADQRWTVGLEEKPAVDGLAGIVLARNTVFLITGAAGSIVSAITVIWRPPGGYLLPARPGADA